LNGFAAVVAALALILVIADDQVNESNQSPLNQAAAKLERIRAEASASKIDLKKTKGRPATAVTPAGVPSGSGKKY
jgi:hypothetical protein